MFRVITCLMLLRGDYEEVQGVDIVLTRVKERPPEIIIGNTITELLRSPIHASVALQSSQSNPGATDQVVQPKNGGQDRGDVHHNLHASKKPQKPRVIQIEHR